MQLIFIVGVDLLKSSSLRRAFGIRAALVMVDYLLIKLDFALIIHLEDHEVLIQLINSQNDIFFK
jgi:hypothetical protein